MQQIGLSVPVIIIKQEEVCQCQCSCRDTSKDKAGSKDCPSFISKTSGSPPAPEPQGFPRTVASTSAAAAAAAGRSSVLPPAGQQSTLLPGSPNQSLSAMEASRFLSLQSLEMASPLVPLEPLLQGEEGLALGSSFP